MVKRKQLKMLPYTTTYEEKKITDANRLSPVYIYGLINPITQKIFYVGKSQTPLLRKHVHIYESKRCAASKKAIVINAIISKNNEVSLIILEEIPFIKFDLHLKREKWWIKSLLADGIKLTNQIHNQ